MPRTPVLPVFRAVAGGTLMMTAVMGIGRFVFTPILPAMLEGTGMRASEAGLIASANFIGYLLGAIWVTLPRLLPGGRYPWFLIGIIASVITTVAMGWVDTLWGFAAMRFASGVASALALVLGTGLVIEHLARLGAPRWATLHFTGVGLGIATSAIIVTVLERWGVGWRGLWYGAGTAAAVAGVLAVLLLPRPVQAALPGHAPSARPGRTPGFLALCANYGLFGFGYVITATFLVAVVRASPSARVVEPVVWLVVGLAVFAAAPLWGAVQRAVGAHRALALSDLVLVVGVLVGGVWATPAAALTAAVMLGLTVTGITAMTLSVARETIPAAALGRGFAIMTVWFSAGQVIGPPLAGMLLDRTGSFAPPSLLAAAGLLVAAGLALIRPPGPGRSPPGAS